MFGLKSGSTNLLPAALHAATIASTSWMPEAPDLDTTAQKYAPQHGIASSVMTTTLSGTVERHFVEASAEQRVTLMSKSFYSARGTPPARPCCSCSREFVQHRIASTNQHPRMGTKQNMSYGAYGVTAQSQHSHSTVTVQSQHSHSTVTAHGH